MPPSGLFTQAIWQGQITYSDGQYAGYEKVAALSHKLSSEGDHVLLLDAATVLETVLSLKWTMANPFFL